MLDEWREKFVLSQQEAMEIYTDMHRAWAGAELWMKPIDKKMFSINFDQFAVQL